MLRTHRHPTRGGAFITVVIFTTVLLILIGSILSWSLTERRLNYRNSLRLEARNAAEAISEFGFYQIRNKLETRSTFAPDAFAVGDDAPVMAPLTFFEGGNVDYPDTELVGGMITIVSTPGFSNAYFVDPNDLNNEFDPLKGKWIFRRDIAVIAKATVQPPANRGAPITAYVSQRLSIRGAPLFAHAIFYNMDLEIAPGPNMTIWGPVHANGSLYISKQGSGPLNFMSQVTATGGLYKGFKTPPIQAHGATEVSQNHDFFFANKAGSLVSLKSGDGVWRDQKMGLSSETDESNGQFRSFASNTFNGNLQTKSHGIQPYKPVAIGDYEEDPTPHDGVDNSKNEGRVLIEPPLPNTHADYNSELEAQKLSRKSGLYIAVNPSGTDRTARMPDGTPYTLPANSVKAFKKDGTEVILPGMAGHSNPGGDPVVTIKPNQMTDLRRHTSTFDYNNNRSGGNTYAGKNINIIEVDMNALKKAVDRTVNGAGSSSVYADYTASSPSSVTIDDTHRIDAFTAADWNGAIYIESVDAEVRKDSGVRLINGRGQVASKSGAAGVADEGLTLATNDAMYILGHFNADGSINSSSTGTSNSARYPETGERPVALAADAITLLSQPTFGNVSGSYTQTGGWNDALSGHRHTDSNWNNNWATANPANNNRVDGISTPTTIDTSLYGGGVATRSMTMKFDGTSSEISAAFLVGVTPSNKNGSNQNSGGVHNLPRFLERWTGTAAIRGSIVVMYESRVADEPWGLRFYGPPTRLWGFNTLFGIEQRYPPQMPLVMSYRRVDFTDLTKAQYDALKAALPSGAGSTGADLLDDET